MPQMLQGNPTQWLEHFKSLEERLIELVETAWPVCIAPLQTPKVR